LLSPVEAEMVGVVAQLLLSLRPVANRDNPVADARLSETHRRATRYLLRGVYRGIFEHKMSGG
jgi:hypothetical protein